VGPFVGLNFGQVLNPYDSLTISGDVAWGFGGANLDFGVTARLRSDRASDIEDEVVDSLGELDRAVEVGPFVGLNFGQVLNPYDSLTISGDVAWDVAGAHEGMTAMPSISYFTPLSRAIATALSLSAVYGDGDFQDYYFRVTPTQSAATGGALPAYEPEGGGFVKAGATLLLAYDLNGNLADGGWALVAVGGYSRALGDAEDTPYTSVRGTADQFLGALGVGYTF
jgi:outer membrane scaffolding protein for murein synthesis (MipA/OmpV family)